MSSAGWARGAAALLALSAGAAIGRGAAEFEGYPVLELRFEGNQKLASEQLLGVCRSRSGARFDRAGFERDQERVVSLYRAQGFLNARIVTTRTEVEEQRQGPAPFGLRLTMVVEEGPYFSLGVLGLDQAAQQKALRAYDHFRRGIAALEAGQPAAAVEALRNSLQADPDSVLVDRLEFGGRSRVRLELALALREIGERSAALQEFRRLVAADPDDVASRLNLGQLQLELGLVAEALASFRATAREFPADGRAGLALGRALLSAGETAEAIAYLGRRADGGDIEARLLLGDALRLAGDLESAAAEYRRAIAAARLDYQGYSRLSRTMEGLGRPDQAAVVLREYLTAFEQAFPEAGGVAAEDGVLIDFQARLEALRISDLGALERQLDAAALPSAGGAIQARAHGRAVPSGGALAVIEIAIDSRQLAYRRSAAGLKASLDLVAEIRSAGGERRRLRERVDLEPPGAIAEDAEPLRHRLMARLGGRPERYRIALRDPLGGQSWLLEGEFGVTARIADAAATR